ncbi:hypothetical protein [Paenibacillus gorillae]|uniref:hypothetical protein n=1 Tax=Paenibacillus gorillae TaxID=1243662 RepID=UPI0005A6DD9A|nr:hypothetical protein [Paenibacillus gorillae]
MNTQQLVQILHDQKKEIIIDSDWIREKTSYFENFYQLIRSNDLWEFSKMDFERKPISEKKDEIIFSDESKAIDYFFYKGI